MGMKDLLTNMTLKMIGRGTHPTKRAFYRAFRDLNPLNDFGSG